MTTHLTEDQRTALTAADTAAAALDARVAAGRDSSDEVVVTPE